MAMAGTAGAAAEGFPARLVLQLEPMIPEPSLAEIPPAAASPAEPAAGTLELHAAGLCEPCRFYFGEEVRCHFGDRCRKCHFCTRHEAKKRWRMLVQDILEWEANVKETDAALRKAKKDAIWDDMPSAKAQWQATTVDGQRRKVATSEPRRLREGAEDALWDEVAGAKAGSDMVTSVNEVPEAHKKHMADSEKEKGNEAFYSRDYKEAEAYYSRSLQYMANDPSTWSNRALVRLKLENPQGALEDCEHALALNGDYVKALHRKGKALYELQRYQDAVKSFQEALQLSPGNSQINGDLMVARRKLRDDVEGPSNHQAKGPKPLADAPSTASVPIEAGYTRVQIEEDSDSEEEPDAKPSGKGFMKIAIEEVSGSEDEAPAGPKKEEFNPPPRVAEAPQVKAGGFDDMD